MMIYSVLFLASLPLAQADSAIYCGNGREAGRAAAEISIVDELESTIKVYLKGKELSDSEFGVAPADGKWIVTIFGHKNLPDHKFIFTVGKKTTAQEYLLNQSRQEKKIGKTLPCLQEKLGH